MNLEKCLVPLAVKMRRIMKKVLTMLLLLLLVLLQLMIIIITTISMNHDNTIHLNVDLTKDHN